AAYTDSPCGQSVSEFCRSSIPFAVSFTASAINVNSQWRRSINGEKSPHNARLDPPKDKGIYQRIVPWQINVARRFLTATQRRIAHTETTSCARTKYCGNLPTYD